MITIGDQVDQCVQVAIEALASIARHEQEIAKHKEEIKCVNRNLSAVIKETGAGLNKSDLQELAYLLYWHTSLPAAVPADLIGVRPGLALTKIIGKGPSGVLCEWCQDEILVESRTDRQGILDNVVFNDHRRDAALNLPLVSILCERCEEQRSQQSDAANRQWYAARAAQLATHKTMPYPQYLQTEHWQAIRKSALKRSRYRCQLCNAGGVLDVHHRTYERRGEELAADVIVLCRKCHDKFHDKESLNG